MGRLLKDYLMNNPELGILNRYRQPETICDIELSSSSSPSSEIAEVGLFGGTDIPPIWDATWDCDNQKSRSSKEGERKMADSQSRYGIIEEMKNKKIVEINKLAALTEEKEKHVNSENDAIDTTKINLDGNKATYKQSHALRQKQQRQKVVELETELKTKLAEYNADYNERITAIQDDITDREESYEDNFKKYVEQQNDAVEQRTKDLAKYIKTKDREIKTKEAIIKEIEQGITDLKQISKEQKGDKE